MADFAKPDKGLKLLEWYGQQAARRVDLVGDYAGKEIFLLDGDSLLLTCFSDPKIDFDDGFQLLHAVYVVERFLSSLMQRHCNFHIVFFESNRECCIPRGIADVKRPRYLLARSVLKRHLVQHSSKAQQIIEVRTFGSVCDIPFQEYLIDTGVYFFMCHDGANVFSMTTVEDHRHHNDDNATMIEAREHTRKIRLRTMIYTLISQGYNIALINGLEFLDTKVMTMVVEGSRTSVPQEKLRSDIASVPFVAHDERIVSSLERSLSSLGLRSSPRVSSNVNDSDGQNGGSAEDDFGMRECHCSQPPKLCSDGLTERASLIVIVLARMLKEKLVTTSLATSFLVHVVLIGSLPLTKRRLKTGFQDDDSQLEMNTFLANFSRLSVLLLEDSMWSQSMQLSESLCDIADLIDGRLLEAIYANAAEYAMNSQQCPSYEILAHALCAISGIHLKLPPYHTSTDIVNEKTEDLYTKAFTILPFSNPVFDRHLSSIHLRIAPSKDSVQQSGRIYQEVSHWHNANRRLDPKSAQQTPASEKDKWRARRRNQFFMSEMQNYAASLTNATGKELKPRIITVDDTDPSKESKIEKLTVNEVQKPKATPNRKSQGKKAILDGIAADHAVKGAENEEKNFASWRTLRKTLDSERSLEAKYAKIKVYLSNLTGSKRANLEAEVNYHLLCILVNIYQRLRQEINTDSISPIAEEAVATVAMIWDACRRLSAMEGLTKTIAHNIINIVNAFRLPDPGIPTVQIDRKLAFDPALSLPKEDELVIEGSEKEFQLQHCGPYMDRDLDSAYDARVPFRPDGWQRRVLDELDAKRSIFVVAPTSAGKTFISFYAMERILRSDHDSVLVYVAPTKALVNQIAAEIQARFSKSYGHPGKSVWAVHTRDYRINNPSGCQILVTVPHILQIMLLAPSNAKSWSPRVKYIIFDEIHSIGQAEDGVIWEQLLLLAPCPIIALSATVGNPETFNSWLSSTQQSSGHQVTMIKHQHRYSDLRKFVFDPPKRFAFVGLSDRSSFATLGLDGLEGLKFIHPISSLVNRSRGIPDDLSLEARDCLSLFRAMKKYQTAEFPVDPALDPLNNKTLPQIIRKADIINWEQQLKQLLKMWMKTDISPFDKVYEDIARPLKITSDHDRQVSRGEITDVETDYFTEIDANNLYTTTLPLLCKLHQRNALPAIFFNYDRHKCENMALAVLKQLEDAEVHYKETSAMWKAKLKGWEEWKKTRSKTAARKPGKALTKKKGKSEDDDPTSKMDRLQDAASDEVSPYANFDPDAPVDGFHFAAKHKADPAELAKDFHQLTRRGVSRWLMIALQRGIGVHHAGMNRKYRQVVEMLFRKGFLRVVIATGTLALGINMPCATVVFSGDSIFLTALNFRQAAGRAGRRGFDLLGNVVFQNVSRGKLCRLLSSRLPDLNGHFPVTTTLILRLFSLLHESGNSPYAIQAINSLLSQPRLYLDGPTFRDQVLHHLRFSIEYLRRQDLLSSQGAPINFAGLTSHLYFTENSSFALNALIKGEYFHGLCSELDTKESHVLRELMLVMAHLFGRRPCREVDSEYINGVVRPSSSIVFLPNLPPQAATILRKHNEDTLQVFATYVKTFVDQHIKTDDDTLPLTRMKAGGSEKSTFPASLPSTKVRSSFVALSGHGDTFESISDLCRTTRSGVFIEDAVIPHLDIYPDESKTPLNAYLYDFYMHGDIESIEKANGVRKSDVWFLLNDFSLVLATITTSLANFLKMPDSDLSLLDIVGEGDEANNAEDDTLAADTIKDTESSATSTASKDTEKTSVKAASTPSGSKPKKKEKIEASWDDWDEDEEKKQEAAEGVVVEDLSKEELERGLLSFYKAMKKLRFEFDTKFRKIFA